MNPLLIEARNEQMKGDLIAALRLGRRAVSHSPDDLEALIFLGDIAVAVGEHSEGRNAYERAYRLAPDDLRCLNNYGLRLIDAGEFDAARGIYMRMLDIDPGNAAAYYNLAAVTPRESAIEIAAEIEKLKTDRARSDTELSLVGFALGRLYDLLGEWDSAFGNYAFGNERARVDFNRADALVAFESTKATFTSENFKSMAAASASVDIFPIFIVGMPRSGSSLVEEMLSRHKNVVGFGERTELARIANAIAKYHPSKLGFPAAALLLSSQHLDGFAKQYVQSLGSKPSGVSHVIDKNLFNFFHAAFIKKLFPKSLIVHARRDPIDSCLSMYFQNFQNSVRFSFSLENIGFYYAYYADLMAHWERVMPGQILEHRYEDTVESPDVAVDALFSAIGLEPPGAELRSRPADRVIHTASAWQARQPIYKTSVKRWKNYEKHLGPLFEALERSGFHYDGDG
ncbi:MAG: hypothetical protein GC153_12900 [Alphaproteobacteria bacterium]|nr:hypothetical protein [Alphaproteobacteria bacterium]